MSDNTNISNFGGFAKPTPSDLFTTRLHTWINMDRSNLTLVGSAIQQIDDLSGNGNHLEAPIASNRPTLQEEGLNGKPIARFNGTSNLLKTVKTITEYKFLSDGSSDYYVVAIFRTLRPATEGLDSIICTGGITTTAIGFIFQSDSRSASGSIDRLRSSVRRGVSSTSASDARSDDDYYSKRSWAAMSAEAKPSGSTAERMTLRVNNVNDVVNLSTDSYSTSDPDELLTVGYEYTLTQSSSLELAEIIIVKGTVTTQERSDLHEYIRNEWGIGIQLPKAHFDASDPYTFNSGSVSNNDSITEWRDKVNGYKAVLLTDATAPTYKSSGGGNNNLPYVEFDGIKNCLSIKDLLNTDFHQHSVFIALQRISAAGNSTPIGDGGVVVDRIVGFTHQESPNRYVWTVYTAYLFAATSLGSNYGVLEYHRNSGGRSTTFGINGGSETTLSTGSNLSTYPANPTTVDIGGTNTSLVQYPYNSKISEILLFNRRLYNQDRIYWSNYITNKHL